jgi:hypothetical protein
LLKILVDIVELAVLAAVLGAVLAAVLAAGVLTARALELGLEL